MKSYLYVAKSTNISPSNLIQSHIYMELPILQICQVEFIKHACETSFKWLLLRTTMIDNIKFTKNKKIKMIDNIKYT